MRGRVDEVLTIVGGVGEVLERDPSRFRVRERRRSMSSWYVEGKGSTTRRASASDLFTERGVVNVEAVGAGGRLHIERCARQRPAPGHRRGAGQLRPTGRS